ncbi:MAG: BatA domain-containing protein [Flammeovirgaceae bacterium]|nr:BatA domain-containing protein [Flammeovirgaceae bacterium]
MIQFAQPIFLWALTALAVPIGIHLLSRKEGKVVKMGSLRHLRETSTQQFKGIKLNELLLLALRCLLIVLFVGLLAGFQWSSTDAKKWVLIEPGLENHPRVKQAIDSLEEEGFEGRWLQHGFPLLEQQQVSEVNYWRAIDDLNNEKLTQGIVFSKSAIKNFDGMRPEIDSVITWISITAEPNEFVLQALKKNENQFLIRKGMTTSENISFTTEQALALPDSLVAEPIRKIKISIVSDELHAPDVQILKAALNAIQLTLPIEFKIQDSKKLEASTDWVFWFSDRLIPANDSTNIVAIRPKTVNQLITKQKVNQWIINKRLTVDVARHENLSLQLAELMLADSKLTTRLNRYDKRVLPDSIIFSGSKKTESVLKAGMIAPSPNKFVLLLFLLVLIVERITAYAKKQ